jgi:hypothetical protein
MHAEAVANKNKGEAMKPKPVDNGGMQHKLPSIHHAKYHEDRSRERAMKNHKNTWHELTTHVPK